MRKDAAAPLAGLDFTTSLPGEGWDKEKVIEEVTSLLGLGDYRAFSGVCHRPQQEKAEVWRTYHMYNMHLFTGRLQARCTGCVPTQTRSTRTPTRA